MKFTQKHKLEEKEKGRRNWGQGWASVLELDTFPETKLPAFKLFKCRTLANLYFQVCFLTIHQSSLIKSMGVDFLYWKHLREIIILPVFLIKPFLFLGRLFVCWQNFSTVLLKFRLPSSWTDIAENGVRKTHSSTSLIKSQIAPSSMEASKAFQGGLCFHPRFKNFIYRVKRHVVNSSYFLSF